MPPVRERLGGPPTGCDEATTRTWLVRTAERADPVMAWLGVVFALLVGFEIAVDDLSPGASRALRGTGWAIWALFVVEFAVRAWQADRRWRYVVTHWPTVIGLVLPLLRVLAFLRLARLGRALPAARVLTSSYRATGTARRLLRSRLGYLGALSTVVVLALAELAYLLERGTTTFGSFGDALLWSLSVVLATQGDPVPVTVLGRLAMNAGFVFGLVVIAGLAGLLGAFFVDDRRERAARDGG